MTANSGDPEFEARRRAEQHRLREHFRQQGGVNDPIHVLACRTPEAPPGARMIGLARWSLAARLVQDATDDGQADEIQDLGPGAMQLCNATEADPDVLPANGPPLWVGLAKGGEWLAWLLPGDPVEPPPAW
jgi:hypothetical protein